jgi:uncharacterized membrane protein
VGARRRATLIPRNSGTVDRGLGIAVAKARQRVESVLTAIRKTDPPYVVVTVMLVCAVALVAGYVLKSCPVSSSRNISLLCYSDIELFYRYRHIATMPFPYVHGGLKGFIEYPVLTGLFAWSTARLAANPAQYLMVSAALLGPLAIMVAYLLARLAGWRALMWSAAPALVLYAFHNWDLLAVAAAVVGVWCWTRGRVGWAGVCFGVGGALKLYPLLFVAPLALEQLAVGRRRAATMALAAGFGTAVAVNLPFAVANFGGWFATYRFHSVRQPNIDSLSSVLVNGRIWNVTLLNILTTGLIILSSVGILVAGHRRFRKDQTYPFLQVCGALLAAFLLWNKVQSPQYTLWILPFFVLLGVRLLWWLAYAAVDGLVYVSVLFLGPKSLDLARPYLKLSIYGRAALLAALILVFLRAQKVTSPPAPAPI